MNSGTITHVNPRRAMFIVRLDDADAFAVFSFNDGIDIAVGDRIWGDLRALGPEQLLHLGQGKPFKTVGQSGESTFQQAARLVAP